MRVIKVEDLPETLPPDHYDLVSRRIVQNYANIKGLVVAWVCMEPSGRTSLHTHDNTEHLFIVINGELGVKTSQGEFRVRSGEAAMISPGEVHGNFNASNGNTEYLLVNYTLST
jgi:quercetin dioxygenase-like cupin family protein